MLIFSYISTKISFALFLETDTFEAVEETVWFENNDRFPNIFISIKLCFCSTTSLAIKGLI